jgi:hypothetical protein
MSKKTNWVDMDKRIRLRKTSWTNEEQKLLDAGLKKLHDSEGKAEIIHVAQPALASSQRGGQDDEPN